MNWKSAGEPAIILDAELYSLAEVYRVSLPGVIDVHDSTIIQE